MSSHFTGGCQCGAVRYRADSAPQNPHICHCRMCQKAAGNYFLALGGVLKSDLTVTRGQISWFHSSDVVRRGFCRLCGTPLAYETIGETWLAITLGSLDRPEAVKPVSQSDVYARMPWFHDLFDLQAEGAKDETDGGSDAYRKIALSNHQHPDHDTRIWSPKERS